MYVWFILVVLYISAHSVVDCVQNCVSLFVYVCLCVRVRVGVRVGVGVRVRVRVGVGVCTCVSVLTCKYLITSLHM